ncbi:unnamed protein product, partial [Durusdinium trenchii]
EAKKRDKKARKREEKEAKEKEAKQKEAKELKEAKAKEEAQEKDQKEKRATKNDKDDTEEASSKSKKQKKEDGDDQERDSSAFRTPSPRRLVSPSPTLSIANVSAWREEAAQRGITLEQHMEEVSQQAIDAMVSEKMGQLVAAQKVKENSSDDEEGDEEKGGNGHAVVPHCPCSESDDESSDDSEDSPQISEDSDGKESSEEENEDEGEGSDSDDMDLGELFGSEDEEEGAEEEESVTNKSEWEKFSRQCLDHKQFPVSLASHYLKDKGDLFRAKKDGSQVEVEFQRRAESKKTSRSQREGMKARDIKKKYPAAKADALIQKLHKSGVFYYDPDFPNDDEERAPVQRRASEKMEECLKKGADGRKFGVSLESLEYSGDLASKMLEFSKKMETVYKKLQGLRSSGSTDEAQYEKMYVQHH